MILGPIGQFQNGDGSWVNGVTLLDVVGQVTSAPKGTKTIVVQIESGGGLKDTGDQIYDYLVSLKKKYKIRTEQLGMIASISTKLFGAGDERVAMEGERFMIHNPWTIVQGDADKVQKTADALKVAEEDLLSFYVELTGIPESGLIPLLDSETEFDAQTALKLNFATDIKTKQEIKIAAMKQPLLNSILSLINRFNGKILNTVVELEDSSKIYFETEDLTKLEGTAVYKVDEQGNPTQESAPDGTYKLKDGRTITIAEGKVSSVSMPEEAMKKEEEEAKAEEKKKEEEMVLNAKMDAIIKALDNLNVMSNEDIIKAIDERFNALKSELKVKHTPKAFNTESNKVDAHSWDVAFKENRISAMKKNDPEMYQRLFFAKYGKMPNI